MNLLSKYAELIVRIGLNVQPGQQVIIQAPVSTLPLVRLVTDEAYKAGASIVVPLFNDEYLTRSRFHHTQDEKNFDVASNWLDDGIAEAFKNGASRLVILGNNPVYLKDINSEHVARVTRSAALAKSSLYKMVTDGTSTWSIASYATPEWAKEVFPEISENKAVEQLWDAIYRINRVYEDNPIQAWKEHNETLKKRCDFLNKMNFEYLHFTNSSGTDIKIGLADRHIWRGGSKKTKTGIANNSNMPTEEVFTTPHRSLVNGVVKSTKPLYYNGNKIDGITAYFKDGVASVTAEEGQDIFQNLILEDENACRLGEVALVPYSSPISSSGILFKETLYDENASCHIAFGTSYSQCITHDENETQENLLERGANKSKIHTDWMIGDQTTKVVGYTFNGEKITILENGEWIPE